MSVFRFFALFFSAFSLSVLISCSNQTPTPNAAAPASPMAQTDAAPDHSMHGGKPKININNAILSELDKLEAKLGVPALSDKIQASRPYAKIDELVSKKCHQPDAVWPS